MHSQKQCRDRDAGAAACRGALARWTHLALIATAWGTTAAYAEIREVRLAPTTVVQHVTDRAQAQTVGLCQIGDLKGKLPTGQAMKERLRTSALLGFHQQGAKVDKSFLAKFSCQQPRWEVMQFRVVLAFDLHELPLPGKPFLAYLSFKPSDPAQMAQMFPEMTFPSPPELGNGSTQKSSLVGGVSVQSKGFLCYSTTPGSGHGLQFMFQYTDLDNTTTASNGCGATSFPPPEPVPEPATVLRLTNGSYLANVAPLLMAARKSGANKIFLVVHGPQAPAGPSAWPTASASRVVGLGDWQISVLSNACNWNQFPSQSC